MRDASNCGVNSPRYNRYEATGNSDGSDTVGLAQYPEVSTAAAESTFITSTNQSSSSSTVQVRSWKLIGVLNGYQDAATCRFRDRLPEHFSLDMNPPPFSTTYFSALPPHQRKDPRPKQFYPSFARLGSCFQKVCEPQRCLIG